MKKNGTFLILFLVYFSWNASYNNIIYYLSY